MEKTGHIVIRIVCSQGNIELKPDSYDIKDIIQIIEQAEKMLSPGEKRERPLISYQIEEGSVLNIFRTSMQAIIGFTAILGQIKDSNSIDFLELPTAQAIEYFQETAIRKNYIFEISTSTPKTINLRIDSSTNFYRTKENWLEAEFYFFGRITNAGGKEKANIHLLTADLGTLYIQTPKQFLAEREENLLYKEFLIRAKGMQNSETGEIDKQSLAFIDVIDHSKQYDDFYLKGLRKNAGKWLRQINPDEWMNDIRG